MHRFTNFSKEERVKNKIEAKKIAESADWENFAVNYIQAQNMAFEKRFK
jgi:hypothetical protein